MAVTAATKILIVEDDAELRAVLRSALEQHPGLEVVAEAADGSSALAVCAARPPGIVLLDLGLPDLAGRDVLSRIRATLPWVRVVLFTGSPDATKAKARAWGAAGLVRKDEDLPRLIGMLERVANDPLVAGLELGRATSSPSAARTFIGQTLRDWGCDGAVKDAQLVVSELVTNAVTHGASGARLNLRLAPGALRIEVFDAGAGSPEPQPIDHDRASGRGLLLVSAVSTAWGIDPANDGKVVWADLPV